MANYIIIIFFKKRTVDEMRISDWSSDVCSSDLRGRGIAFSGSLAGSGPNEEFGHGEIGNIEEEGHDGVEPAAEMVGAKIAHNKIPERIFHAVEPRAHGEGEETDGPGPMGVEPARPGLGEGAFGATAHERTVEQTGSASWRERGCREG